MRASGHLRFTRATAGSVCTTSPSELGLITKMERGESNAWPLAQQSSRARTPVLTAFCKAAGEPRRQAAVENALLRRVDVIFDPAEFHDAIGDVVNRVGGAPIAIAWLSDAADIEKVF